jgi:CrcB protein
MNGFFAVGLGAACGAWLRWGLSTLLNTCLPQFPLGTLVTNLFGGFLMGLVLGWMHSVEQFPVELRLLLTTGFLGGLTTFSAFSAESFGLLIRHQYFWAAIHTISHVLGALLFTAAGFYLMLSLKH